MRNSIIVTHQAVESEVEQLTSIFSNMTNISFNHYRLDYPVIHQFVKKELH